VVVVVLFVVVAVAVAVFEVVAALVVVIIVVVVAAVSLVLPQNCYFNYSFFGVARNGHPEHQSIIGSFV
jgi:hypothetical protein